MDSWKFLLLPGAGQSQDVCLNHSWADLVAPWRLGHPKGTRRAVWDSGLVLVSVTWKEQGGTFPRQVVESLLFQNPDNRLPPSGTVVSPVGIFLFGSIS